MHLLLLLLALYDECMRKNEKKEEREKKARKEIFGGLFEQYPKKRNRENEEPLSMTIFARSLPPPPLFVGKAGKIDDEASVKTDNFPITSQKQQKKIETRVIEEH